MRFAPTADLNAAYEAGDLRMPLTVIAATRRDYQGVKFPTTIGAEHLHVIRFAEVMLIQAEALARLGQLAAAVDEYNKIRVRAGLAPHVLGVDVTTQADVLAAIDHERRARARARRRSLARSRSHRPGSERPRTLKREPDSLPDSCERDQHRSRADAEPRVLVVCSAMGWVTVTRWPSPSFFH